ncbi:FkbM family methyltransferase [Alphaproteobacteria bacterium]|nr:FkbM family methyltransferase [Alphaproteobacteria bacterium]
MNNFASHIGEVKAKHGVFSFCHFDEYIGLSLREYGEFSEIELSLMSKFIMKEDVVFDIGSNIGAFTVPFAKKVGELGQVYAFEPQKVIYDLLQDNVNKNKLKNVKIFNVGMGKKKEELELNEIDYSKVGNFGGVSFKYDSSSFTKNIKNKKYKVKITNLNEFMEIEKCNFMKIDVELMELDILTGGKNFLKKFRPILWIENHEFYPNEINKFLLENDYNAYWVYSNMFNESNYFINDNNYFGELSTLNTLAIPKEDYRFSMDKQFDKILDLYTKPQTALKKLIK